jgi:hypothetical protein
MTLILLHEPVACTSPDTLNEFERVHMFPGRHLGEEEFDLGQAYADLRLAALLRGRNAGIVRGLDINLGPNGVNSDGFSVNPGLALDGNGRCVSLYYPLRVQWQDVISEYLTASGKTDATGVYYLLLKRSNREIDSPVVDPDERDEFDPTRDTRLVVTGSLVLKQLNIVPGSVATTPRDLIENLVVADRVDASFMATLGTAAPLALLAIGPATGGGFAPVWLSQEAGRYEALPNSGYRVLLNQASAALRRVMQRAATEVTDAAQLPKYLTDNLHLDYLPAAGQLPLQWLQDPASKTPRVLWLPSHLGIDMVPVPEEAVLELINRDIARRVIDLRHPAGDKIRLLVAVNEPDYRADLLDIPQTDAVLEADIYRFYIRAYDAWRRWDEQFKKLYFVEPSYEPPLPDLQGAAIEKVVRDPAQFKYLDLPTPVQQPIAPQAFYGIEIKQADDELDPGNATIAYPFNKGVPAAPLFYTQWLVNGAPPVPADPNEDGLVVQYALALVDMEAIENQLRAIRTRVEKTRDLLLLMRQQLDSQTVALAALAGGVAGDGSGLQVARWLPYTSLGTPETTTTTKTAMTTPVSIPMIAKASASGAVPVASAAIVGAAKEVASSGLTLDLMNQALTSSSTVAKSNILLASKPESFSAFELGINKTRLNLLSQVTKEAVSKPAFEAKEYRFGVIDHISPDVNEYSKAYYGMKELIATITDLFDPTDAAALRYDLQRVGRIDEDGEGPGQASPFERSGRLEAPAVLDNLATKNARTDDDGNPVPAVDITKRRALLLNQYRYHALFKAGRILTQWIAICESRYNVIERKLQGKLREQAAKAAEIDKLVGLVRVAREALENLDRFRIEQLGDYGVAQRLLDEDWRHVYAVDQERTRVLTTAVCGLYYVRVRNTPVSAALADPLALRYGSSRDIVPGCDWEQDVDLPDVLDPFFKTVCEIPMDDWARLKPLRPKLPPFQSFDYLGQLRQTRFSALPVEMPTTSEKKTLQARLQTVHLQNRSVIQQWATLTLPAFTTSSLQTQAEASKVLSVQDLSLSTGPLRKEAQDLRDQLEHCVYYLLQKLNVLPGSIRLQWGQLAEDDQIRVEDVSWWPGLDRAEADDFNAARTVAELIAWWFRQLATDASANSKSALRNMIRAALIHASLGDPQEIVRGNVYVPPRLTRIGEKLQVKLNRAPAPGTRLQLLDGDQRVVAILSVEDHTPESTHVSIVDLVKSDIAINTRFSVIANKNTQDKL